MAVGGQIGCDGEDAVIVGLGLQRTRQGRQVPMIHLDPQRAPLGGHRNWLIQSAMFHAQRLERAQSLPGSPAELWMVSLALELGDGGQRHHHLVLLEGAHRTRVREDNARVEHVGLRAASHPGASRCWMAERYGGRMYRT